MLGVLLLLFAIAILQALCVLLKDATPWYLQIVSRSEDLYGIGIIEYPWPG